MTPDDTYHKSELAHAAQWLIEQTEKVTLPLDCDLLLAVAEELRRHDLRNEALRQGALRTRMDAEGQCWKYPEPLPEGSE